jgi:VWFA-related protein
MRRPLAFLLAVLAAAHTGAQSPQPPDPQTIFRTGVDLVRLDVSVLDKNRQPIHGLRAEDFTVLADGQPQPVVAFAAVDIPSPPPVAAGWMREVGSDVVTNQLDLRRIVVILMDDGMSAPDDGVPNAAKQIARGVIERLGPNDLAAVVFTLPGKAQNFTTDRRLLIAAADSFSPRATIEAGRFTAAAPNPRGTQVGPPLSGAPLGCLMPGGGGNCLTTTLKTVAAALENTPVGRKTIVLISSGVPYKFTMENLDAANDINDLRRTFSQLQRANVNVYPFDPRGLTQEGIMSERIDSLRMFAENTGGHATVATNTPWEQVAQVFLENSSYYLLGIRPAGGKSNGFRRVKIQVKRPDAEVRSRAGYFATAPARARAKEPPTELEKAFAGALPSGNLPVDVSVAPFAAADGKQGVVVVTTGVRRPVRDATTVEKLDVRTAAFNVGDTKERASHRQGAEITLRPNATGERRVELYSRLALKPGRYEIRSAAETSGSAGGVFTQLEVPDFSKARLSLSGLVLGFARNGDTDGLADLLPIVPTAARAFPRSAQIAAFVRVYQGGKDAPVPVQMHLRIVDANTQATVDESIVLEPPRFGPRRAADCPFQLPLSRLGEGEYLLTIEAAAGKNTARRDVRFRVVGD